MYLRIDRQQVELPMAENPDGKLLPGNFAEVEVVMTEMPEAILIPAIALVPGLNFASQRIDQIGAGILPFEYWVDESFRLHLMSSMNKVYILETENG